MVQQYTWSMPTQSFNPAPDRAHGLQRVASKHRLTGSMNYQPHQLDAGHDQQPQLLVPRLPDHRQPAVRRAGRRPNRCGRRSGANLVNEFRVGGTGGATFFSPELAPTMWKGDGGSAIRAVIVSTSTAAAAGPASADKPRSRQQPDVARGVDQRRRRCRDLDQRLPHRDVRRLDASGRRLACQPEPRADDHVRPSTREPVTSMFTTANFPNAAANDFTQAAGAVRDSHRTHLAADRHREHLADDTQYVCLGKSARPRAHAGVRLLCRRHVAREAEPHGERAACATTCGCRSIPCNNSYTTTDEASMYGHLGRRQSLQAQHAHRLKPSLTQYPTGEYAYNADHNNLAPSVGVAWQLNGRERRSRPLISASEQGDSVIRGGFAMAYNRPGHVGLHRRLRSEPRHQRRARSNRHARQPRHAAVAAPDATRSSCRPPAVALSDHAVVPATASTSSTPTCRCRIPRRGPSAGSGSSDATWRSSSATSAAVTARHWQTINFNEINIPRTASSTSSGRRRPTCRRTWPPAVARRSPTPARRDVAAADLPRVLQRGVGGSAANDPAQYRHATGPIRRSSGSSRPYNPNPCGFASTNSTSG